MDAVMTGPRLGFIGLGKMGAPMARRLVAAGHDVVVHDISPRAMRPLKAAGARTAKSPREVAAHASIVCTCLPNLEAVRSAATYEAFVLGAKAGLDPDAMLEVINASTGANNCTLYKMPRAVLPRTFDYGSNMEITYKDISLCMKEAERLGVTMFLGNMARQLWAYGVNHGGAKRDSSTLITHFEQWAGVKVVGAAARTRR